MNGTGSVVVDDVSLTDATDFDRLALDALRGGGQFGSRRGDNFPVDWIFRAYDELKARSSPFADRPAAGVAACLTAPEPEVRAQALVFFQRHPRAAGGERVVDLVAGDRELFAGVPDPVYPCTDLFWQLLAALAARLASGDERALERAQSEVLRPGDALPLVAELTAAAPAWAFAHAESIAQGTPAAGASLLIQLQNSGRDVVALAERIADWCQADPRFELDISRFIDNPAMRREILLKFHSFEGDEMGPSVPGPVPGHRCEHGLMTAWRDFEQAEPEFARRVRGLFDAHRHKTIATLRADGSPRISGIEVKFEDGELSFGSMPNARKGADLRRDPRFALHSATVDPVEGAEAKWPGEAKISGRASAAGQVAGEADGDLFHAEIAEVVHTHLNEEATRLVVEWWTPAAGLRRIERE